MTSANVASEIRERIQELELVGKGKEEIRETLKGELKASLEVATIQLFPVLQAMPHTVPNLITSMNDGLGIANEVLFKEFDLVPFHISELELSIVKTYESYSGKKVDELLSKELN